MTKKRLHRSPEEKTVPHDAVMTITTLVRHRGESSLHHQPRGRVHAGPTQRISDLAFVAHAGTFHCVVAALPVEFEPHLNWESDAGG